jgi:hypothetical protein
MMMPMKNRPLLLLPNASKFFGALLHGHELAAVLFRLVEVFVRGFLSWVRFFTAPFRALSPVGLLTAILPPNHISRCAPNLFNAP